MSSAAARLAQLQGQLAAGDGGGPSSLLHAAQAQLARAPASAAVKGLPRFDPYIMETYLDDLRDLKRTVYDLFKFRPELLPAVEEGMSKGAQRRSLRLRAAVAACVCAVTVCIWGLRAGVIQG